MRYIYDFDNRYPICTQCSPDANDDTSNDPCTCNDGYRFNELTDKSEISTWDVQYIKQETQRNAPHVILDSSHRKILTHALTSFHRTLKKEKILELRKGHVLPHMHSFSSMIFWLCVPHRKYYFAPSSAWIIQLLHPMTHGYTDP